MRGGRGCECPLLVLWGEKGVVHRLFDPLDDWRERRARRARARRCRAGHYLAEEAPEETLAELQAFFAA